MRTPSPVDRGIAIAHARQRDGMRADATPAGVVRDPLSNFWYGDPSSIGDAGVSVNAESALASGAVFRATELIANSVAQLDPILYKEDAKGVRRVLKDYPLRRLLTRRPNSWQSPFEFRQMLTAHAVLRGNGYARIVPGASGFADELHPLRPDRMSKVEQLESGELRYTYNPPGIAQPQTFLGREIFHLRGWSEDGLVGISRITKMRTSVGLDIAAERFAAKAYSRAPKMSFALKIKGKFKDEGQARRIGESFREASAGPEGWHRIPVVDQETEIVNVGLSARDAEFLASREFSVLTIARWLGVPAHLLGDQSRTTENIEQQTLDFLVHGLMAWLEMWEGAIERDLLLDEETQVEFDTRGLLRADLAARSAYWTSATGRRAWASPNEARVDEGMEPIDDDPEMNKVHEGLGSTLGAPKPDAKASGADGGSAPKQPAGNPSTRRGAGANRLPINGHARA